MAYKKLNLKSDEPDFVTTLSPRTSPRKPRETLGEREQGDEATQFQKIETYRDTHTEGEGFMTLSVYERHFDTFYYINKIIYLFIKGLQTNRLGDVFGDGAVTAWVASLFNQTCRIQRFTAGHPDQNNPSPHLRTAARVGDIEAKGLMMSKVVGYIDRWQAVFMAGCALGLVMGSVITRQKDASAPMKASPQLCATYVAWKAASRLDASGMDRLCQ